MQGFAVIDRSRPKGASQQILMLVTERRDAEEVAFELRRKGHPVLVREVGDHGPLPHRSG
jgi:hypothetical protein